ncbi:MAG TPA: hypothetical protein VK149_04360 [Sideroxyarcus sp.]|nr:hypothetical protein [Sideroxyarcus sp.]
MTWATPADVEARWVGSSIPADSDVVEALISDAEAIVLSEYPGIQARIDDASLAQAVVVMVVCRMVMRVLRNPEALTYWQQNTGPFGQGKNYGSGNADIWMSSEEVELLAPKRRGKAFSVDLAPNAYPGVPVSAYEPANQFPPLFGLLDSDD